MMKYIILLVSLLLLQHGGHCMNGKNPCLEGSYRVVENITTLDESEEGYIEGTLEICYNGTYYGVCADGSHQLQETVSSICLSLGYDIGATNVSIADEDDGDNSIITAISCPVEFTSFSQCNLTVASHSECSDPDEALLLVACSKISINLPECFFNGQIRISNNVTTSSSTNNSITGELEVCVEGGYHPVCGINELNDDVLQLACESIGYTDGSYSLSYQGSDSIIDSISCDDPLFNLAQCNFSINDDNNSCSDPSGTNGVRITCSRGIGCNDGDVRLNSQISIPNFGGSGPTIIGFLEICFDEQYTPVCIDNTSSIDLNEVATLSCHQLGYPPVRTSSEITGFPRFTDSDMDVIIDIDCPDYATNLSSCSLVTTGSCPSNFMDALLQCQTLLPTITVTPEDVTALQFTNITFSCQFSGYPIPQVQWIFSTLLIDDVPTILNSTGPYTIVTSDDDSTGVMNSTLTVSSVTLTNAGAYTCRPNNEARAGRAMLEVVAIPTVTLTTTDQSGTPPTETNAYTLSCIVRNSHPVLSVSWWKDSNIAIVDSSRFTIFDFNMLNFTTRYYTTTSLLTIKSLTLSDTGSYTCRTSPVPVLNESIISLPLFLDVHVPPTITVTPEDVTTLQLTNVTFSCQFSGYPTPQVEWTFRRLLMSGLPTILESTGPYTIVTNDDNNTGVVNSTLTVSSVTLTNAGAYTCRANNAVGTQPSGKADLTVIVIPTVTLTSNLPSGTPLTEANVYTFICTVSNSYPVLSVSWRKDSNITIVGSSRISITSYHAQDFDSLYYTTKSFLTIYSLTLSDTGSYTCRTSPVPLLNQPVISSPLSLSVQVRNECVIHAPSGQSSPCTNGYCIDGYNDFYCQCFAGYTGVTCNERVITPRPPVLITPPSPQSVLLQDLAEFKCTVTGEPQPAITWYKDGEVIPGEPLPSLTIPSVKVSDRGEYSCSANNSEGIITSESALLRIQNVAQYVSTVNSSTTSTRRKRQSTTVEEFLADVRDLFIGREVGSDAVIVALDAFLMSEDIQAVFTVHTPVTEDGRPNTAGLTDGLNTLITTVVMQRPDLSFTPVIRFDGCTSDSTTLLDSVELRWPEIGAKETASVPCPCGNISDNTGLRATRMCYGDFTSISKWLTPDTEKCQYNELSQQLCTASEVMDPLQGAKILSNVTSDVRLFTEVDLAIAAALLFNYAETDNLTAEVASELISTVGKMVDIPLNILSANPEQAKEVLDSIDSIASNIELDENGRATVVQPNIAITAQRVTPDNFTGLMYSIATDGEGRLGEDVLSSGQPSTASVEVPDTLLQGIPDAQRVALSVQTNSTFYVQSSPNGSAANPVTVIISFDVITGAGKADVTHLDPPITFHFFTGSRTTSTSNTATTTVCSFWNTSNSEWSTNGCETVVNDDAIICSCSHLSSFTAVEIQDMSRPVTTPTPTPTSGTMSGPITTSTIPTSVSRVMTTPTSTPTNGTTKEQEEYKPQPIIIVGVVIAILVILSAVLLHLFSANQRSTSEGKIIISSHLCLIVLYVTLVLACIASYTDSTVFCGIMSGLFHFISLVYVTWLFTEGLYYIIKLKYGNSLTRHLFKIMLVVSFAIPLLIIIISVSAGHDYYAVDNSFCRPQSYPFYIGYIIPLVLTYIVSMIFYIKTTIEVLLQPAKGSENSFRRKLLHPHALSAMILSVIIMVVWTFGMVGTDNGVLGGASTATQYIFGLSIIVHAVVLFVLTLYRTEDTRQVLISLFDRLTGRRGKYSLPIDSEDMDQSMAHGIKMEVQENTEEESIASDDVEQDKDNTSQISGQQPKSEDQETEDKQKMKNETDIQEIGR